MRSDRVLLFTDVVDSTRVTEELGDEAASVLWAAHDRAARRLLRQWNGCEIDKSDGFLLLFDQVDDAVAFAMALHRAMASMTPPLRCRAGIHRGAMVTRANDRDDVMLGAKPFELDGVAKAIASRIMTLARGGQTLLSGSARKALLGNERHVVSLGHWRMKGLAEPLELFEVGEFGAPLPPPPDSEKAYRVSQVEGGWRSAVDLPHGLPAERDEFVGRVESLRLVAEKFDKGSRLVTLHGIGGMGKTRLALQYARDWLGSYPGGAWFCDLSTASTLDGVLHAVAQGLRVPLGKSDPVSLLGKAISGRGCCLLVVDNFEQVVTHAEATVGRWLENAPAARMLVTSREVLAIAGEETLDVASMSAGEAARLFESRAVAAGWRPTNDPTNRAALATLVELLDRLPLAIELAAARALVMGPAAMLERMGERFRLLARTHGRRDRQSTLRTTLDWSWELLTQVERSTLAQMSVFEGGFALRSLEEVLDFDSFDAQPWPLDVLQSLTAKSLVRKTGDHRFGLLRSVQAYAEERLQALPDRGAAARARHARHFARLDEAEATADRCAELENAVAASRRAAMAGDLDTAAGAVATAWYGLRLTGPYSVAIELAESLVEHAGESRLAAATAHWVIGNASHLTGRTAAARKSLEEALSLVEAGSELEGHIACALGTIEAVGGGVDRAAALFERALVLARAGGDVTSTCRALNGLGALADMQSQPSRARAWYEAGLAVARQSNDARWQGALLGNLAQLHHQHGDLEAARICYEEGLTLVVRSGDLRFEGNMRCNLGLLHHECGNGVAARDALLAAMAIAKRIGHVQLQGVALANLSLVADSRDDLDEAIANGQAAVNVADAAGNSRDAALYRVYLGRALARSGCSLQAAAAFEGAEQRLAEAANARVTALLQCARAEAAWRAGDRDAAIDRLQRVRSLASPEMLGGDAELARELDRVTAVISRC